MVQGMAFLSKKGFNPHNQVNRKNVWEAQQASKQEKERIRQRQEQLRREREDEELCAARHGGDGSQAQLRFMYDAPPGMADKKTEGEAKPTESSSDVTQIQPGDDAAAAAFRRMLAKASQGEPDNKEEDEEEFNANAEEAKLSFGPVLQGSTLDANEQQQPGDEIKNLSALEKAVGRKDRGGALTLEEQVARFPQLKNAPMAKGMSSTDVNVSFKPLGSQLRNVKCLACGVWGHSRGDRECSKSGWDPFSTIQRPVMATTTIRPQQTTTTTEKRRYNRNDASTSSSSSDSSSSDEEEKKKRKRKHKSRSRKRHKEGKRHRRSRSDSPSRRRRKTTKKKRKKRSRDY